jgi:FKBP-type peptidyl-prolyl cis-trans isomerase (trigger factor)
LLRRIAAKENFQASDPEILEQVLYHAKRRAVKPAQLLREFQEQGLIDQIREAIVREKVMEHLESQAELLD